MPDGSRILPGQGAVYKSRHGRFTRASAGALQEPPPARYTGSPGLSRSAGAWETAARKMSLRLT